ncbi:MAG: hypothetical protein Q8L48_04200 [Archangium sp.]|nr:hypothetical protein [Archangium sp.]
MNPRLRRVLFIVTAAAVLSRLFVLGQERGFPLVARATLTVTLASLAAWLVHLVLHELAHWAAAAWQDFEVRSVRFGPVLFDFTGPRVVVRRGGDLGGGVASLPRGVERLSARLRVVAMAGPLMTLCVTLGALARWRVSGSGSLASPLGIFLVMGGFTLVTALLPGALLPRRPESGTDLEQMIQPRAILGHWVNAAAVQGLSKGKQVSEVLDWRAVQPLLPAGDAPVEAIELGWCIACLDAGQVDLARPRLRSMAERLDDESAEWLRTDVFNQLGCLSALEGDPVHAQACLTEVREWQSTEWYCELLVACIARAQGDSVGAEAALARWRAGVDSHPGRVFAIGGNQWVLSRLEKRGQATLLLAESRDAAPRGGEQ